jgi:hypothetical protein
MQWKSKAAALCAAWAVAFAACAARTDQDFERQHPSADAREMAAWVQASDDAGGKPYLIVDKKAARLFVFEADGRLLAATPVILGAALGDSSTPGVGERAQNGTLTAEDKTTPAGRYDTQPGRNIDGEHVVWLDYGEALALHRLQREHVVWLDYGEALALHRLRPGRSYKTRAARLASSQPQERRLSLGCVVVPVAFYLDVVKPLLGSRSGVVYVLPETQSARELFVQL